MGIVNHLQANAESNDRGLIDLDTYRNDNFALFGFKLSKVFDDILLVQYADLADETGDTVMRNGGAIPLAHVSKAWRIGKVVLAGHKCQQTKVNDYVCFPSDKGIPCSNLDVDNVGVLKDAIFLNEERVFGVCKPVENESKPRNTRKTAGRKRRGN